jgi:hypothetical protein
LIRVSASAFDILWTDLGHDRPPEPLTVRSVGGTDSERAEVRKAVYENLAERGLYDGTLAPALASRLDVLAGGEVFVACEALADMTAEAPFRAVTATRGRHGVLATQPEQTIGLDSILPSELCTALVDVLPELSAGPGYGINLAASELSGSPSAAGGPGDPGPAGLRGGTVQREPAFGVGPGFPGGRADVVRHGRRGVLRDQDRGPGWAGVGERDPGRQRAARFPRRSPGHPGDLRPPFRCSE